MSFFQSSQSFNKSIRSFGTVETLECRQLLVANAIQVIADSFGTRIYGEPCSTCFL